MDQDEIMEGIRNHDSEAMDYVIGKYSRLLWSVVTPILRHQGTTEDMEECVADVFIYLWQHPEAYDPDRGKLKSWLAVIARSKALDRCRAIKRRQEWALEDTASFTGQDVFDALLEKQLHGELYTQIQSLSEPGREILMRRYFYDQKPRQIAKALGLSVKQVENHLFRSKAKLRNRVDK